MRETQSVFANGWVLYPPLQEASPQSVHTFIMIIFASILILLAGVGYYLWRTRRYTSLTVLLSGFIAPVSVLGWFIWQLNSVRYRSQFFTIDGNGDEVLFQHTLWYLKHPETQTFIFKAFLFCLGTFWLGRYLLSRRRYGFLIALGLGVSGYLLWLRAFMQKAQQLFVEGRGFEAAQLFNPGILLSLTAYGVLGVLLWKLWRAGRPNLYAGLFFFSGLVFCAAVVISGLQLSSTGLDHVLHDTYYVVAHYQYAMLPGLMFLGFAFLYQLWMQLFQVPPNRYLVLAHWVSFTVSWGLMWVPQVFLSLEGVPRRYVNYQKPWEYWHLISSSGYIVTVISWAIFAICIAETVYRRYKDKKAEPIR